MSLFETAPFNTLPTRDEVLSLSIGAFNPDSFSDSQVTYSLSESSSDVQAYVASDSGAIGATSTIFRVVNDYGEVTWIKNMDSTISLGGLYELRNPPSFMNLAKIELRDAEYEST